MIDQFNLGCDRNAVTAQFNELASKSQLRSNLAIKKSENNSAVAASASAADEPTTNDMETLYWHTHGSLLWQH